MFPEDKHLETFLVPNKKSPEPPSPVVEAIKVAITITIPITLFKLLVDINPTVEIGTRGVPANPNSVPTSPSGEPLPEDRSPFDPPVPISPTDSFSPVPTDPTVPPDESNDPGDIPSNPSQPYVNGRWIRIPSFCNGFHADGANFRVSPSLNVSAIKGVVLVGDRVFLTDETRTDIDGNGIIWYRAFNELPLTRSVEDGALNILDANQEGWIAGCFVEHL